MSGRGTDLVLWEPGAVRPTDVVDVSTGELLSLDAPSEDLIAMRVRSKELGAQLRAVNAAIDDEIKRRMDHDLRWTVEAPTIGVRASAPSPAQRLTVPDPAALNKLLQAMLDADEISAAAKYAAISPKPVEYDVKVAGLKALWKRDDLRERLQTVITKAQPPRPVKYS